MKGILMLFLTGFLALLFIAAGMMKIVLPLDQHFAAFVGFAGRPIVKLVAILEILGAVGLFLPRFATLAAKCLALLMFSTVVIGTSIADQSSVKPALVALVMLGMLIYIRLTSPEMHEE